METIEAIPQERLQQCTIAPIMQVVTREQFHNEVEHTPQRKVRFATEDDVQIIAETSRRAEIREITRALAVLGMTLRSWSAWSSPSSPSKKIQVIALSKPSTET